MGGGTLIRGQRTPTRDLMDIRPLAAAAQERLGISRPVHHRHGDVGPAAGLVQAGSAHSHPYPHPSWTQECLYLDVSFPLLCLWAH